ncbi:muramidase family protein [Parafrigoribacterium soli]|uniref:muramidase family protein n=1 Tax=Parafrigoribacterium soli TaxID=3144663 RepID=UPI0032F04259
MTSTTEHEARHSARKDGVARDRARIVKGMMNTIPIVLVGSMALSLNLTAPIQAATPKRNDKPKTTPSELAKSIRDAFAGSAASTVSAPAATSASSTAAASAPGTYRVQAGDTVSSIAGKYGLATASVLALNGLGWKSVIFPGQVLKLTKSGAAPTPPRAQTPSSGRYTITSGDTVGKIASKFGVSTQAVLSANGLSHSSIIYPGQTLAIPTVSVASFTPAPVSHVTPITPPAGTTNVTSSYVITSGDTLSKIASKFGVTIQAILNANGLGWSSIIYTGRTLTIPGAAVLTTATSAPSGLTAEMSKNARTILSVGRSLGVSDYGLVIALAAAMQESGLRNLDYGDRDSLGLFQQRPSVGWGTPAQITNPAHASKLFFGGPSNPNFGNTKGLLDISGWQSMTVTQAAQAVQRSAYPDAYAKWEASAWVWLDLLG